MQLFFFFFFYVPMQLNVNSKRETMGSRDTKIKYHPSKLLDWVCPFQKDSQLPSIQTFCLLIPPIKNNFKKYICDPEGGCFPSPEPRSCVTSARTVFLLIGEESIVPDYMTMR